MSQLTYLAHNAVSIMASNVDIKPDNVTFNAVMPEEAEDDPDNWIGAQYVYFTKQKPQTRLQIVFAEPSLRAMAPDSDHYKERFATTPVTLRTEWLSQFNDHPDPKVKAQLLELVNRLGPDFDAYGIPWEKEFELMPKEQRDALAGLQGIFFPTLHFHNPEQEWDVVVRCEPVVTIENETSNE